MKFKDQNRQLIITALSVWVISMAAFTPVKAADRRCQIEMRPTASVSGQMVYLKDVADIITPDNALKERLARIEIVRSPLVGQTRWVMKDQVERQLKQHGFDSQQWQLSSVGPTKVMQPSVSLSSGKIRSAVEHHIRSNAPWEPEQLKIGAIKFKRDLKVPPGKVALGVRTPKHSDWLGAVLFSVNVQVNGRLIQKVTVPANIEVWSDVVLAAKPLGKFQPINAKGIKTVRMNLARVPANAILDAEQVIGQRTKRNIAVNSVLRSDQVEMPPLVKRGDRVQAIAVSPTMKVTVQALVKESGGKGEMIRVLNLRSKKVIYAQVVDAQTVSVQF